jgi:hypothetical protein
MSSNQSGAPATGPVWGVVLRGEDGAIPVETTVRTFPSRTAARTDASRRNQSVRNGRYSAVRLTLSRA